MRIVAGEYGGRKLNVPRGYDVRPTSDKVRGAIFNALISRIDLDGVHVLDAFCGTGALGLEAISRGARSCMFIDKAKKSLDLARMNAAEFGVQMARFMMKDTTKIGDRVDDVPPADLVFLDPPYERGLIAPALSALVDGGWICDGAIIVAESEKGFSQGLPPQFTALDERIYKDTKIIYASYSAPE